MLARDESKVPEKVDPKDAKKQPQKVEKKEDKKKGGPTDGIFSFGENKLKFESWEISPCRGSILPNEVATITVN